MPDIFVFKRAPLRHGRFLLWMGVLMPALLAATALVLRHSGGDAALSRLFYDGASGRFQAASSGWAELLFHRLGRSLLQALWLMLVAAAIASHWLDALASFRQPLWTPAAAMALGPLLVTLLKDINSHPCPWDLQQFGGAAIDSARWFVDRAHAGRCFPGGHAAGGFSLLTLAFAGQLLGHRRLRALGLALGLVTGLAFSLLRVAQGAHFMSHNLWSAAIDLWVAVLVFAPSLLAPAGRDAPAFARAGSPGAP